MPARRDALVAAVAAHNRSHKRLPNSAVRLLEAMFDSGDVCQQSVEALEDAARRHQASGSSPAAPAGTPPGRAVPNKASCRWDFSRETRLPICSPHQD
jgi:hypothetical protein